MSPASCVFPFSTHTWSDEPHNLQQTTFPVVKLSQRTLCERASGRKSAGTVGLSAGTDEGSPDGAATAVVPARRVVREHSRVRFAAPWRAACALAGPVPSALHTCQLADFNLPKRILGTLSLIGELTTE